MTFLTAYWKPLAILVAVCLVAGLAYSHGKRTVQSAAAKAAEDAKIKGAEDERAKIAPEQAAAKQEIARLKALGVVQGLEVTRLRGVVAKTEQDRAAARQAADTLRGASADALLDALHTGGFQSVRMSPCSKPVVR